MIVLSSLFCTSCSRAHLVKDYPAAAQAHEQLAGILDDETMQRLNYLVDHNQQNPAMVARELLQSRGLLGPRSLCTIDLTRNELMMADVGMLLQGESKGGTGLRRPLERGVLTLGQALALQKEPTYVE